MTDPILRNVPVAFETERLLIRAPQPGEGAVINAAILESLEELKPWMPWVHPAPSIEDSESHSRLMHAKFIQREDLHLRLWCKRSGELVGSSGLHRINWEVPKFEIGYWCRTKFAGQGYITEAVRGITRLAFEVLDAQRVELRCDALNERSRRVIERCCFTPEGHLRHDTRGTDGTVRDSLIFSLTPHEFEPLATAWPQIKVL